jgi:hypothetical protein
MADKREQILVRLEELLVAIAATNTENTFVYRDRAELEESELPAYVLLDGNETKELGSSNKRGPQIMSLTPQVFYIPVPPENQLNTGIGPQLSEHRIKLLKGIMQDGHLQDLVGDTGYIEYRGMETDMQTGAEVKGQFKIEFALAYVFNFNKL